MTQRERLAAGGAAGTTSRPGHGLPPPAEPPAAPPALSWDELNAHATPAQREELITLARAQGVVYAHQLPTPLNGSASSERGSLALTRILAGRLDDLAPVPVLPVEWRDAALTDEQREAVACALHTPDVFLVEGAAGTGKSRAVAEIVVQTALRGERVLVVSATAAAADRILELLAPAEEVYPVRCVEPGEAVDQLPGWSRSLTFSARLAQTTTEPLDKARQAVAELDTALQSLHGLGTTFDTLREMAAAAEGAEQQLQAIAHERAALGADTRPERLGPWHEALLAERDARQREFTEQEAGLRERQSRAEQELAALQSRLAALQPLAEAKQAGQWWRPAWWRATFHSGALAECASLLEHQQKAVADLAQLAEESRQLDGDRQRAEEHFTADLRRLEAAEAARLRVALAATEASLRADLQIVRQRWEAALTTLPDAALRPSEITVAACAAAEQLWRRQLQACDDERGWTVGWVRNLEATAASSAARVAGYVNVVCGTLSGWRADPHFGDTADPLPVFDRMIVQEAEHLTRADLLHLGPRARRWVLVAGEIGSADVTPPPGRTVVAPVRAFAQLWQSLHLESRRLPYEWCREQRRLVCRLRRLTPEQRGRLEREPVFDCPDVELRIWHPPNSEPVLAEIAFPESFGLGHAKQYVFRELDELAAVPATSYVRWRETDAGVILEFGAAPPRAEAVRIAAGVTEVLDAPTDPAALPRTAQLVFERCHGWDRSRAQEFVARFLGLCDLRRTARLTKPQRSQPGLGAVIAELLGHDVADPTPQPGGATCANGCAVAVEFVSVARTAEPSRTARPSALARGGAGLELDLTDRRHRDRLPSDLRPELPERGFVNYLEACAIIRTLEDWVADPARAGESSAVAVIALYPSQAFLLRRLADRSPVLRQGKLPLEIGVPEAFREREFPVVLVSLTRSHVHRAVAFGEGPRQLALALTRASRKLILFGDPGTLVRRGQWEGRLEHLNEADAAWERAWAERVVRYLDGAGRHQRLFHYREGSLT